MAKGSVATVEIVKYYNKQTSNEQDLVAEEEPLEIRLDFGKKESRSTKSIAITMRTPGHDFELALGFLSSEGIIQSPDQIHLVRYCTDMQTIENKENIVRVYLKDNVVIDLEHLKRNFYTTSSCGICGKESLTQVKLICTPATFLPFSISKSTLLQLPHTLRSKQNIFEYTGGLHAAALFDKNGNLLLLREDVGRHNALDKLIGASLFLEKEKIDLTQHILLLSGRVSFELIQKAAMAHISVVCAVGAPSSLAVQTAKEFNITLIGFLRENRFNIYHDERKIIR